MDDPEQEEGFHASTDPEELGREFHEFFELVDEQIDGVDPEETDERLRRILAEAGYAGLEAPRDLGDLSGGVAEWEGACAPGATLRAAEAEARVEVALREAAIQTARAEEASRVAAEAERRAAQVTAGANAYVDAELDRAAAIVADASAEATRIVSEAMRYADRIVDAVRARVPSTFRSCKHHGPRGFNPRATGAETDLPTTVGGGVALISSTRQPSDDMVVEPVGAHRQRKVTDGLDQTVPVSGRRPTPGLRQQPLDARPVISRNGGWSRLLRDL